MRILNEELVKYSIIKPVDLRAMSLVSALLNSWRHRISRFQDFKKMEIFVVLSWG